MPLISKLYFPDFFILDSKDALYKLIIKFKKQVDV